MKRINFGALALFALAAGCQSDTMMSPDTLAKLSPQASFNGVTGSATGSAHFLAFEPGQCLIVNNGCPFPQGIATRDLAFHALRYADGSVSGQWQSVAGSAILHGPIDCLTIAPDGRSARVSGLVTHAKATLFMPGTAFAMEVFDNSAGGSSDPDESTAIAVFRNLAPEVGRAFCETGAIPEGANLVPIPSAQGNVSIRVRG